MIENLFLSVGAMKAGTTWLYEQFKDHPEIFFTPEKEIHYFANKVGIDNQLGHKARIEKLKACLHRYHAGNAMHIARHVDEIAWYAEYARPQQITNDWYENLFRMNDARKYCADFSNLYCLMEAPGWENVRKVAKSAKVIYTLRDPLARLWSHYKFHMKWVKREDEALDVGFEHFRQILEKPWFWANAEYAKNYRLLRENIPEKDLLILYFEDFREDPVGKLNEVQEFLGVEKVAFGEEALGRKVNKTKEFEPPQEWLQHMKDRLDPLCRQMKEAGIWHPRWQEMGSVTMQNRRPARGIERAQQDVSAPNAAGGGKPSAANSKGTGPRENPAMDNMQRLFGKYSPASRWRVRQCLLDEAFQLGLLKQVRELSGSIDSFIDVGANVGVYSISAARYGYKNILAIEPSPDSYQVMTENIGLNDLGGVVRPFSVALSNTEGSVNFIQKSPLDTANKIDTEGTAGGTTVKAMRLDDVLKDFDKRNSYIKIDVEGHEEYVLEGAGYSLQHRFAFIQLEVLAKYPGRRKKICDQMRALGYEYLFRAGGDLMFLHRQFAELKDDICESYYSYNQSVQRTFRYIAAKGSIALTEEETKRDFIRLFGGFPGVLPPVPK